MRQERVGGENKLGPPRDFFGYGPHPPHPRWPGDARIAINFNLNSRPAESDRYWKATIRAKTY